MIIFFFNDTATTEIYTLSLHDALPILLRLLLLEQVHLRNPLEEAAVLLRGGAPLDLAHQLDDLDRKSTRLNSSHANISYAVFCLKKKKNTTFNNINHT